MPSRGPDASAALEPAEIATDNIGMTIECEIYRCSKQDEMYLYLRSGLLPDKLPGALLKLTGRLTKVMQLSLTPERKLARADAAAVRARLEADGFFLQMPPAGHIKAHLNDAD